MHLLSEIFGYLLVYLMVTSVVMAIYLVLDRLFARDPIEDQARAFVIGMLGLGPWFVVVVIFVGLGFLAELGNLIRDPRGTIAIWKEIWAT